MHGSRSMASGSSSIVLECSSDRSILVTIAVVVAETVAGVVMSVVRIFRGWVRGARTK